MAVTTLPLITDSLQATIAAVTPTWKGDVDKFVLVDDMNSARLEEFGGASGLERVFQVGTGDGHEGSIQHPGAGEWVQQFIVEIYYPRVANMATLRRQIMQDFMDVKKALDDPANWIATTVFHQHVPDEQPEIIVARKAYIRQINVVVQAMLARST